MTERYEDECAEHVRAAEHALYSDPETAAMAYAVWQVMQVRSRDYVSRRAVETAAALSLAFRARLEGEAGRDVTVLALPTTALLTLRRVWEDSGDCTALQYAVRDLFDGRDGTLATINAALGTNDTGEADRD